MAKYKVAIIGSTGRGDYGHGLDIVWQKFDDCEVVAVADQDAAGPVLFASCLYKMPVFIRLVYKFNNLTSLVWLMLSPS